MFPCKFSHFFYKLQMGFSAFWGNGLVLDHKRSLMNSKWFQFYYPNAPVCRNTCCTSLCRPSFLGLQPVLEPHAKVLLIIAVFLRFITSWYSCCCTYPSFQSAGFYTFPSFWYAGFYTFPRFRYIGFYTFPRIRQCFSQRILSFLTFFALISMLRGSR